MGLRGLGLKFGPFGINTEKKLRAKNNTIESGKLKTKKRETG